MIDIWVFKSNVLYIWGGGVVVFYGGTEQKNKKKERGCISLFNVLRDPNSHMQLQSCRFQTPDVDDENFYPIFNTAKTKTLSV